MVILLLVLYSNLTKNTVSQFETKAVLRLGSEVGHSVEITPFRLSPKARGCANHRHQLGARSVSRPSNIPCVRKKECSCGLVHVTELEEPLRISTYCLQLEETLTGSPCFYSTAYFATCKKSCNSLQFGCHELPVNQLGEQLNQATALSNNTKHLSTFGCPILFDTLYDQGIDDSVFETKINTPIRCPYLLIACYPSCIAQDSSSFADQRCLPDRNPVCRKLQRHSRVRKDSIA